MPIVQINMLEGRTEEQKADLVREVTSALCRTVNTSPEKVRIIINDMPLNNYAVGGVLVKHQK
jgi:4-oxalocrotonate tautomerase